MLAQAILHQPTRSFVFPLTPRDICVRIRTGRGDVRECRVHYRNLRREAENEEHEQPMVCYARDAEFDHFEAVMHTASTARYLRYYFSLRDRRGTICYLGCRGVSGTGPGDHSFYFPGANERDVRSVPAWAPGTVFYQIFPDRFCNGDLSNDPPGVRQWCEGPSRSSFFGGDLRGITGKLDYLADLGVGAIYLNPVFLSGSNHKYDTSDYLRIDPVFGLTDDLLELVRQSHARGIRVILDGVFNHCGIGFQPFQDLLNKGDASRYRDWFIVESFPVVTEPPNYECWGYFGGMPKLRTSNPEVRAYLIEVARHWVRETGIDGWRFDVADEVEYKFWQELREALKCIDPGILLLAEAWQDAQDMLRGDQMDSVMNYPLRELALDFFVRRTIGPSGLDAGLNQLIARYPGITVSALYNPLDSHDTPRFLHLCSGDAQRFKLAVGFQMTFPGAPAIYYGDEVGLTGGDDPECRGTMIWDCARQNHDILAWYKRLVALRRSRPSLSRGGYRSIVCDDGASVYGYLRSLGEEETYVVLNNAPEEREVVVPVCRREDSMTYRDLLTGDVYAPHAIRGRQGGRLHNHDIMRFEGTVAIRLQGYSISMLAAG